MNITTKILQRTGYIKTDGTRNIFLRLTIGRQQTFIQLNIYSNPDHFKNGRITKDDQDYQSKNLLLGEYDRRVTNIIQNSRIEGWIINKHTFKSDLFNEAYGSDSFYDYVDEQIKRLTGKLTPGSLKNYKDQKNKLKSFRSELLIKDVDLSFIQSYESYLINERGNNKNTIIKSMTFIKTILNRALEKELIKENPFKYHKLGRIEGHREFLNLKELNSLEELFYKKSLTRAQQNVLRYFLFCCYTGMRHIDIKKLIFTDIKENLFVKYKQTKTGDWVTVPLVEKSRSLIPKKLFKNQNVFRVVCNQPTNRHLKSIMKAAKIDKQISFHCARHTFATVSKSLGMEYDVISKILGHADRKTTMIYAKYETEFLAKEMLRWEK